MTKKIGKKLIYFVHIIKIYYYLLLKDLKASLKVTTFFDGNVSVWLMFLCHSLDFIDKWKMYITILSQKVNIQPVESVSWTEAIRNNDKL